MPTQRLPLGTSAKTMVEELLRLQSKMERLHSRDMLTSLFDPQAMVKHLAEAGELDKAMRHELQELIEIFQHADRLRKQGMGGNDIYYHGDSGE